MADTERSDRSRERVTLEEIAAMKDAGGRLLFGTNPIPLGGGQANYGDGYTTQGEDKNYYNPLNAVNQQVVNIGGVPYARAGAFFSPGSDADKFSQMQGYQYSPEWGHLVQIGSPAHSKLNEDKTPKGSIFQRFGPLIALGALGAVASPALAAGAAGAEAPAATAGLDWAAIDAGQAVAPWSTNPSVASLGGAAGTAGGLSVTPGGSTIAQMASKLFGGGTAGTPGLGDAISIGTPIAGALINSSAAKSAQDAQAQATDRAAGIAGDATARTVAEYARQYDLTRGDLLGQQAQNRTDLAPYQAAGVSALSEMQKLLGLGGAPAAENISQRPEFSKKFSTEDFWNDPVIKASYQAGLDQGTKALKNAAPLTTGLDSGAALKELTKFGTDYTAQRAGESYGRFSNDQEAAYRRATTDQGNQFNRLASLAGTGQTAVNTGVASGANTNSTLANAGANATSGFGNATMAGANTIGNLYSSMGNATAASRIAGANAWGQGLQSIGNWWNQQNLLDRVFPQGAR